MRMHRFLLPLGLLLSAASLHADVLYSDNFDSYATGTDATSLSSISAAFGAGDSVTITNAQSLSSPNSLVFHKQTAGTEPSVFFLFSSPVTAATQGLNLSFSFQKVDDTYDPQIWVMFGGPNAGFAKGNIGLRNNGLNNFFSTTNDNFQYTGQGSNWLTLNVAYTFTNDGTNITGYSADFTTSGGSNNPSFSLTTTGLSIASIDSLRLQFRGTPGDVYFDDVSITTAVPEPSTVLLTGAGLAVLALRRRRS